MQINLLPKSKEQEKKQEKASFLAYSFSGLLIGAVAILATVLYVMNAIQRNTINDLNKSIALTQGSINQYADLEKSITAVVSGLNDTKQILDTRPKWGNLYKEIEALMPKETFLTDITSSKTQITFKTKTISVEKVAEFIVSLKNFGISKGNGDQAQKTKLFSDIEISNYSKEIKGLNTYYMFDVKANFSEDVWKIN